jgi:hypothetical protein
MITSFKAWNLREAHLLQGYLEARGVPCRVVGGAHHSVRGELPIPDFQPQVQLEDGTQAALAQELVDAYFRELREEPTGEPWTCPSCGESIEAPFAACWKCGTEMP